MKKRTVVLTVLDGYGINPNREGNAIEQADTPNLSRLFSEYPNTIVHTSGLDVGLPEGQMGNSEVGHTNIGAGRVVYQEFTRITKSIEDGDFFGKEELLEAIRNCRTHSSKLHLYGLLSDGGVHSHIDHLYVLIELAKREGLKDVYIHCFLDGRDVPPACAKEYIRALESIMHDAGIGKIATVMGRYYAMDRDARWDRVKLAYDAMVLSKGETAHSGEEAVENAYGRGETDEFVKPTVILQDGRPVAAIEENDSIIFYNFRPDRAREITRAFTDVDFSGFERAKGYFPVFYVCMTQYDATMTNVTVAYKPQNLENTLGEYISRLGLKQLRIAETEKYAHVTFFFNGGVERTYEGEDRILIPSPKVATYDLKPEMSAYEVTDAVVERIKSGEYDLIVLNYANCDMVGHTGIMEAAVKAVEAVDRCVGRVADAVKSINGILIITADHGNSDQMIDYVTREPFTAHTTNPGPFILMGYGNVKLSAGKLADIAPTILEIMGLDIPAEMTGKSLISRY